MLLAQFSFKDSPLEFYKAPNGQPVVTAASLIKALKGNANNAAAIARANVREKWIIQIPTSRGGRPTLCLFEPGAYQLAGNPMFQTELAEEFQDWLFEQVLPKLRAQKLYVPRENGESLEDYQVRELALIEENSRLKAEKAIVFTEGKQAAANLLPQPERVTNPQRHIYKVAV